MSYDPKKLSSEQVDAAKRIFDRFHMTLPWVMLVAEMQSGKTGTFLLVAAEMLREKKVEKVIIICGNSEKELKAQLQKDMREFRPKYRKYLKDDLNISEDERETIMNRLEDAIEYKSGADLDAKHDDQTELMNTLIIWEESHFGSGKINRPNKFLERNGIRANGDRTLLDENSNYVLSVSATSFSEQSDLYHEENPNQQKEIEYLKPGQGYRGVGYYLNHNKIIGFKPKSWKTALQTILQGKYAGVRNKYAIVRVNGDEKMAEANSIATENGWAYKIFDAEHVAIAKKTRDSSMMLSLNELENRPEQNTVVFIRGMCRMGKVIPKEHIVFVMETSPSPKTDTLLQGLLGRMCGYHTFDIDIYVSESILIKKTGHGTSELEKYLKGVENQDVISIPTKAAHLVSGSTREHVYDLMPIVVSGFVEDRDDPDYSEFRTERVIQVVKDSMHTGRGVVNHNGPNHTAELHRQLADPTTKLYVRKMEKKRGGVNPTYFTVPEKFSGILAGQTEKGAVRSMDGCGVNTTQINIWVFPTDKFRQLGFPKGTLIVQAASNTPEDSETIKVPRTTGKEAFSSKREDETVVVSNGTCAITIKPETAKSVEEMKLALSELVQMSLEPRDNVTVARCVTSNANAASGTWQGILVNEAVYQALQKGGSIYTHLKTTFRVKVKTMGKSGPCSKESKASGLKRLCKIEW